MKKKIKLCIIFVYCLISASFAQDTSNNALPTIIDSTTKYVNDYSPKIITYLDTIFINVNQKLGLEKLTVGTSYNIELNIKNPIDLSGNLNGAGTGVLNPKDGSGNTDKGSGNTDKGTGDIKQGGGLSEGEVAPVKVEIATDCFCAVPAQDEPIELDPKGGGGEIRSLLRLTPPDDEENTGIVSVYFTKSFPNQTPDEPKYMFAKQVFILNYSSKF